ncbi:hypothetical protein JKP88DRAFT_165252 [Tribonema minus]|uniref:Attractin/MKLN-like beta-propeller domain-containing protein n=1 Tax=Tribonema minus TaxID=303371 RepID=A0A836CDJ9_9STRA|nr:hypothetical protein JKP88DRAFT_165252 [Tribonema minus]
MCSRYILNQHREWLHLNTFGDRPCARSGQSSVVVRDKIYVFGGCDGVVDYNDLHCFDTVMHEWSVMHSEGGPTPRAAFGMCAGPGAEDFTIACGSNTQYMSAYSYGWSYDTRRRKWTELFESPKALYGVSICWHGHILLMYAGTTGSEYCNHLYAFDLRIAGVVKVSTSGSCPSRRYKHESVIVDDCMYILGGGSFAPTESCMYINQLNLRSLVWQQVKVQNDTSTPRTAFSCCVDPETLKVWVFGGFDADNTRIQAFQNYDLTSNEWKVVQTVCSPDARAFHSVIYAQGSLYLMLGANGKRKLMMFGNIEFEALHPRCKCWQRTHI